MESMQKSRFCQNSEDPNGVQQQSLGSRSAPWVRVEQSHINVNEVVQQRDAM